MKNTIGFSQMSSHNRLTLLNLIREHREISRADLVKLTPLTAPSVSRIIGELKEQDLIIEKGIGESTGGRKPILFEFNPYSRVAISIAVVRERVDMAVLDFSPAIIEQKRVTYPGPSDDPEIIDFIAETICDFIISMEKYRHRTVGIGLSLPGLINIQNGVVRYSSPMGWHNINLKERIEAVTEIPVYMENSIIATTIAEKLFGKESEKKNFIYLYVGMGIGAGIVINGRPYRGVKYSSMEVGHMTIAIEDGYCTCGKRGCWEALAGTPVLLERYGALSGETVDAGWKDGSVDTRLDYLVERYNEGESAALEAVEKTVRYLAIGMANMVNIFNPEFILLSGWPTRFPAGLFKEIRGLAEEYSMEGMVESLVLEKSSFDHPKELLIGGGAVVLHSFLYDNVSAV